MPHGNDFASFRDELINLVVGSQLGKSFVPAPAGLEPEI